MEGNGLNKRIVRPYVTDTGATKLVETLYGLTVTGIKKLNSYDDQNFHVSVQPSSTNPSISEVWQHGYVLKILNAIDSEDPEHMEGQTELLKHLYNKKIRLDGNEIQFPVPVKNMHGNYWSREKLHSKLDENAKETEELPYDYYIVRLLLFAPGKIFYQVPYTPEILFQAGKLCGEVNKALEDFHHPSFSRRDVLWRLDYVPRISEYVQAFDDERKQKIIHEVIDAFQTEVLDKIMDLPKGILHGDVNEQNILVKERESKDGAKYSICGMIDVGDAHYNCYIFEVAIGMAYMMIESKIIDPLLAGGHFLAGYLQVHPMTSKELDILWVCVAGRLAQSLTFGWDGYLKDPRNTYLLVTQENGWKLLEKLWATNKEELLKKWHTVIASYN